MSRIDHASSRSSFRNAVAVVSAVSAALCSIAFPGAALAEIERTVGSNGEPSNLVNISPIRFELDVQPGVRTVQRVSVTNDSDQPVKVTTDVVDLATSRDKSLLAVPADDAAFGASEWVTAELRETVMKPFENIKFDVVIDPPPDAPVGSSYAGVEFSIAGDVDGIQPGEQAPQIGLKIVSVLQLLLNVPGEVRNDLRLIEAETRNSFQLGGQGFVSYGIRYRNDGTVNDHAQATLTVESLFGNEVTKLRFRDLTIIRGGTRSDRVVWSDTPRFGVFSATVRFHGDDDEVIVRDLGRVYLLPPWWLVALIVMTLTVPPIYLWWRRRREWMLYLEHEDEDEDLAY